MEDLKEVNFVQTSEIFGEKIVEKSLQLLSKKSIMEIIEEKRGFLGRLEDSIFEYLKA